MARHKLIQSFILSLKVKSENPIREPPIYSIVDAEESGPIQVWIGKGKVDNVRLTMPKSQDITIRADRNNSRQYSFLESMDPVNMIKEKTSIPCFVFEYFAQKEISDLINKTFEKTCLFYFNEADGHGIISALIVMVKLRRHLEFLDDVSFKAS